jgi:hypothetical protein
MLNIARDLVELREGRPENLTQLTLPDDVHPVDLQIAADDLVRWVIDRSYGMSTPLLIRPKFLWARAVSRLFELNSELAEVFSFKSDTVDYSDRLSASDRSGFEAYIVENVPLGPVRVSRRPLREGEMEQ